MEVLMGKSQMRVQMTQLGVLECGGPLGNPSGLAMEV